MKTRVLTILFVSIIILSGCVGVNGEPLEIPDGNQMYGNGFVDGCMSSILALTTPQNLPPYEEALAKCNQIYDLSKEGVVRLWAAIQIRPLVFRCPQAVHA